MRLRNLTTASGESYPIYTGAGLLEKIGEMLREILPPCRAMIVTDSNVAPLYLERACGALRGAGFEVSSEVVPAGEESKSFAVLERVTEDFAQARLTRSDLAVALGGGVVGDLTGFAAGCYLRGIRFAQIPTTLLAAVDASVGGKTAVNLRHGKNLAGVFHQPVAVICDTDTLATLDALQLADGAAEAIKQGILGDETLFGIYESGSPETELEEIIDRCVAYKASVVAADPREKGLRKLLNLGHTPAHAIELLSDFEISHGHAVAVGIAMAARAAQRGGLLRAEDRDRILSALTRANLPVTCPYSPEEMARAAVNDKKAADTHITIILPERIGHCRMETIPIQNLQDFFEAGMEENS